MKKIMVLFVLFLLNGKAFAQFTADQMCEKLSGADSGNNVYMFVEGYDVEQKKTVQQFFTFEVKEETKLGDFFDKKKAGTIYETSKNKISYDYKQYSFGRLLTQLMGIPKPLVSGKPSEIAKKDVTLNANGDAVTAEP